MKIHEMGMKNMHSDVNFETHTPRHITANEMVVILPYNHTGPLEWEDSLSGDLLFGKRH